MSKEDARFETSDLYLTAYLIALGSELLDTESSQPSRIVFVLTPRPGPGVLAEYMEGKADVNVGDFVRALRGLKKKLWDLRRDLVARGALQ